jgi:putative peptidoglycan lipid II flippase
MSPIFYALRQSRTAVAASLAAIAVNLLLSLSLIGSLGFRGLALATSVTALADGGLLVLLLRRRLKGIEGDRLMIVLTKIVASAAVAVAAWGISK